MRLFGIILLGIMVGACTDPTDSSEEQVDTVADAAAETVTPVTDVVPTAVDQTTTSEDVLVIDTVVVEPSTDTTEEE
tara:strand:- start:785 stop:1015 length:231 start_codon:yes stop_codon:yes gene_type:complete